MRVNDSNKSVDIEQRDLNFILGTYVRTYMFISKNEDPDEIIVPMFESIQHPTKKGVSIPVRYVPPLSPEAIEITQDGADIPDVATEEDIAKADATEEAVHAIAEASGAVEPPFEIGDHDEEERIDEAEELPEPVLPEIPDEPPAPIPLEPGEESEPKREPRQPEHPATGHPDNMHPRRSDDDTRKIAKALEQGSGDVDDQPSKPFEKVIKRDASGEPVVEDASE